MDSLLVKNYGAPETLWFNYTVDATTGDLYIELQLFNKVHQYTFNNSQSVDNSIQTSTRLDEALWLAFTPSPISGLSFKMDKLGSLIDPLEVMVNGSQHQHAVSWGLLFIILVFLQNPTVCRLELA